MIRLRIDGVECDLPAQESLPHFGKMYDLAALADPCGRTNPVPVTRDLVERILQAVAP